MPETIVRTFSLLSETDRKLEELTRLTYRRNKGDVIDWLVAEAHEKIVPLATVPAESVASETTPSISQ